MSKLLKILFLIIIFFNLFLSSWYVLHGDVDYSSEAARDLYLMEEVSEKKIVLIGPNSSTGLFHGPLWTYINYPFFALGNGNPVIVGWGWIVFISMFIASGFYIGKKLFDKNTGYLFSLMLSVYCVYIAKNLYNPHGAMFLIPVFFFFFIRYIQTLKIRYLIIHILIAGMIIQFQMAVGIPFLILSFLFIACKVIKSGKMIHLLSFMLILFTLSNFIIFDFRHNFLLSHQVLNFIDSGSKGYQFLPEMLEQRFRFIVGGTEILKVDTYGYNYLLFFILILLIIVQIKNNKHKEIYLSFLYFYFGYLILSNLNGGGLLYFYLFPIFPLAFLIFSSFSSSRFSGYFLIILFTVLIINEYNVIKYDLVRLNTFSGKDEASWMFYKNLSLEVFNGNEKEFGYYVYSPDVIGYRPKYAMYYESTLSPKKSFYFEKKPVTYLIIAPPPQNNPYMKDEWWKKNMMHLNKEPVSVVNFNNGYKIEKYLLTEEEIKIPTEPGIDPGLHFR